MIERSCVHIVLAYTDVCVQCNNLTIIKYLQHFSRFFIYDCFLGYYPFLAGEGSGRAPDGRCETHPGGRALEE